MELPHNENPEDGLRNLILAANQGINDNLVWKAYLHKIGGSKVPVADAVVALVIDYLEMAVEKGGTEYDQMTRASGMIGAAALELRNVREFLEEASIDIVLAEFWRWFMAQGRTQFGLRLFMSWLQVHPSPELQMAKPDPFLARLREKLVEFRTLTTDEMLSVRPEDLAKYMEIFDLKRLEIPEEPAKAETVPVNQEPK